MSQLIEKVYEAGIVGAGGAGFPTHVKMDGQADTLIINGAECEPLLQVDKALMNAYAEELIEGIALIVKEQKLKNAIIGVKSKYDEIIARLSGYAKGKPYIQVKPLPNIYPVGDEVVLIQEMTGITLERGVLPIQHKLVVMNVETVLNIHRKMFDDSNVTQSYVTITGEVEHPGTYNIPIGTSLEYLLEAVCPPKISGYEVVVGGPMTGRIADAGEVVRKNTKGFIVLPKDHWLIRNMENVNKTHLKRIMASCSQCRLCTDMCPRHLLGHKVEPHKVMNAMANGLTGDPDVLQTALGCVSCGVCELYACHHDLSPRKMMVAVKAAYAKEGVRPQPEGCTDIHPDRDYRKVPSKRLVMHLNLTKYDVHYPFYKDLIQVDRIMVPLNQHIGPFGACVAIGQKVIRGQEIASNAEGNWARTSMPASAVW